MTHNIQVTIYTFAFGALCGIGTLFFLAFNGAHIASVLTLTYRAGFGNDLVTFMVGHGVVELSCIFIAGGAGLLIGSAMVMPGNLTRADALKTRGMEAVRRSKEIVSQRWGLAVTGQVSIHFLIGLCVTLPAIGLGVLGMGMMATSAAMGGVLVALAGALFIGGMVLASALGQLYNAALYEFATANDVPPGFDSGTLTSAFRPRRGGRPRASSALRATPRGARGRASRRRSRERPRS